MIEKSALNGYDLPHMLRHSFATRFVDMVLICVSVQELFGHAYYHQYISIHMLQTNV